MSLSVKAPQFTVVKAPERPDRRWMARARTSLLMPLCTTASTRPMASSRPTIAQPARKRLGARQSDCAAITSGYRDM
jgi:hypothetical protein